jgi:DNA polymerase-3 subunit alpha
MELMEVMPLFKSQYSVGKSILTLAESEIPKKPLDRTYPVSVFDIAKEHKLGEVVLVDDSISGFLEAHQNAKKTGVKLIFGLKLRCMEDIGNKSDASLKTIHKLIIFIKNNQGYKDLIKISSLAAKEGFYYKPNIDMTNLKRLWTENLILGIPFYDSFLFNNSIYGHLCVPSFFTKPVFFIENSQLPFDAIIQKRVENYAKSMGGEVIPARSIYYYRKDDFVAYLTFRCINDRTSLDKPEFEHMSSDNFSFEQWEHQQKRGGIHE